MDNNLQKRIEDIINSGEIVIFMKGDKNRALCGFSANTKKIIESFGVEYEAFNVLEDEDIRQGVKEYSDWPTFPQVYVYGELIGGNDIVTEMYNEGELEDILKNKKGH